ncbi:MAG: PUA domain-containing protein [Candidatus Thorarchaeota archaeon]
MGEKIRDQVMDLAQKYHFSIDLINRFCFYYGYSRSEKIIQALKEHPKTYALRVNTLLTTPEELIASLAEKEISAKQHPVIKEAVLVDVIGPIELQLKEKSVIAHRAAANKVITGSSLVSAGIAQQENLNIGDEVSIVDKYSSHVGNGIVMMSSSEINSQKNGIAVKVTESRYKLHNLQNLKEFLRGHFIEQSLPSMIIGAQIDLKPEDRVFDMSVGEGEILTHVWQRNSNIKSRIIANENSTTKVQKFEDNLKRLRMRNNPFEIMNIGLKHIQNKFNRDETFDWIILTPPCSEIGLRPKVADTTPEQHIVKLVQLQKRFMQIAARLIKPRGTIFYSTSSLDQQENEGLIQFAVEELGLKVAIQNIFLGEHGNTSFQGAENLQHFYPDMNDTDGYFIAKLTK